MYDVSYILYLLQYMSLFFLLHGWILYGQILYNIPSIDIDTYFLLFYYSSSDLYVFYPESVIIPQILVKKKRMPCLMYICQIPLIIYFYKLN